MLIYPPPRPVSCPFLAPGSLAQEFLLDFVVARAGESKEDSVACLQVRHGSFSVSEGVAVNEYRYRCLVTGVVGLIRKLERKASMPHDDSFAGVFFCGSSDTRYSRFQDKKLCQRLFYFSLMVGICSRTSITSSPPSFCSKSLWGSPQSPDKQRNRVQPRLLASRSCGGAYLGKPRDHR